MVKENRKTSFLMHLFGWASTTRCSRPECTRKGKITF